MNLPIGISLSDKIKLLREREGLTQNEFCELAGIAQSTLASLERGRNKTVGVNVLSKIVSHPRFFPYAMWLLVDELTEDEAMDTLEYLRSLQARNK